VTLIERSKTAGAPAALKAAALSERIKASVLAKKIASGRAVIPFSAVRGKPSKGFIVCAIGEGLRTKVNANIGTSPDSASVEKELKKLRVAIEAGADTVMDLSTGGNVRKIREKILKDSTVPVGTVPIYQAACETVSRGAKISKMDPERMFGVIEEHAASGVDFMTVHCGITRRSVRALMREKRVCGVVSRGGAFLTDWIIENGKENPLFERFDRLLDIAYRYDTTLSLGDGMRPGAISDANDPAQTSELAALAVLVSEARRRNVQVIVEGPGHMPINAIREHVLLEKKLTGGAPFYVLGPITTDVAPGYDHITSAIGGALAASYGADFLCYVTPSEHLHLPDADDVRQGVIAARIAAHSADIAKGIPGSAEWDREFSRYRVKLDWNSQMKNSMDPGKFALERRKFSPRDRNVCTMCGPYCAMKLMNKVVGCASN
jgi:phosphomethylpyrimidine synthase